MKTCNYIAHETPQEATHGLFYVAQRTIIGATADAVDNKERIVSRLCNTCKFECGRLPNAKHFAGHLSGRITEARRGLKLPLTPNGSLIGTAGWMESLTIKKIGQ